MLVLLLYKLEFIIIKEVKINDKSGNLALLPITLILKIL